MNQNIVQNSALYTGDAELCQLCVQPFFQLVRDSFQFKRKNIRNNLKKYDLSIILSVLNQHGYDLNVRAEQLSVEMFVELANALVL